MKLALAAAIARSYVPPAFYEDRIDNGREPTQNRD